MTLFDQIQSAIKAGDTEQAKALLLGAGPGLPNSDDSSSNFNVNQQFAGRTLLYYAVSRSRVGIIRLLLQHGADANQQGQGGKTVLHHACWGRVGHVGVVRALLQEGGADPNIQDDKGRTALHWSGCLGRVKLGELLLEHKADITVRDNGGLTALDAVSREHPEFMVLLLKHGGDPNHRDQTGQTLLHKWAAADAAEVVEALIEHGADPNKTEQQNGHVPLDVACQTGSLSSIYVLFKRMITDGGLSSKKAGSSLEDVRSDF